MIYQYGGTSYSVSLEPLAEGKFRATIGERVVEGTAQAFDQGWLLTLGGQQIAVYCAVRLTERYLSVDGAMFILGAAAERRRTSGAGSSDLAAQMPGQIREVLVQPGEMVKRGQTLLVLEAMKMEIRVAAPTEGRVKRLLIQAGDVVDRGQRLVEMEENREGSR